MHPARPARRFSARLLALAIAPLAVAPPPAFAGIQEAVRQYQETRTAPIISDGAITRHPFPSDPAAPPRLLCSPLRLCSVGFGHDEQITYVGLGDSQRWLLDAQDTPEPLIAVKPTDCDIATNLLVTTSRPGGAIRTYDLLLHAPPCDDPAKRAASTTTAYSHIRFWYPEAELAALNAELGRQTRDAARRAAPENPVAETSPADWDFAYSWRVPRRAKRKGLVPWAPKVIFNDGEAIHMLLDRPAKDLPAELLLFAGGGRGEDALRLDPVRRGPWLIAPTLDSELLFVGANGQPLLEVRHDG